VVHAVDGIRAVAGADSRAELVGLLAEYVEQRFGAVARPPNSLGWAASSMRQSA
jgi:hypothetical protein